MTDPPTRLMLRQKSSSGSRSRKHLPRLPTARTPGTTVGHSPVGEKHGDTDGLR